MTQRLFFEEYGRTHLPIYLITMGSLFRVSCHSNKSSKSEWFPKSSFFSLPELQLHLSYNHEPTASTGVLALSMAHSQSIVPTSQFHSITPI